jgi:hypothetical protein
MKNKLWKLFKETGDVRVFNLLGKVEGSKKYGKHKSGRDSNR